MGTAKRREVRPGKGCGCCKPFFVFWSEAAARGQGEEMGDAASGAVSGRKKKKRIQGERVARGVVGVFASIRHTKKESSCADVAAKQRRVQFGEHHRLAQCLLRQPLLSFRWPLPSQHSCPLRPHTFAAVVPAQSKRGGFNCDLRRRIKCAGRRWLTVLAIGNFAAFEGLWFAIGMKQRKGRRATHGTFS